MSIRDPRLSKRRSEIVSSRARTERAALAFIGVVAAAAVIGASAPSANAQKLAAELVVGGLDSPVWVGAAPGDPDRLFFIQRFTGKIEIVKNGQRLPTPFLDITGKYRARVDGGFLGMAFHPDYFNNRYFYIYYTDTNGDAVVFRYQVSENDPDVADESTEILILKILRNPDDDLHPGGFIDFSPTDGYLYISTGDAGPQGDPNDHSQDPQLLLGKILRIDVDGGFPYAIPEDNPFVDDPNTLDEIWAIGFRNPWRACFDRATGDLYVGDVGFSSWEEVSFIPDGAGGGNYGWAIKEGTHCHRPREDCDPFGLLIDPIHEYAHRFIPPIRCSVTGGNVYRGSALPLYTGRYFFGDFCSNEIWSFRHVNGQMTGFTEHTDELGGGGGIPSLSSFGQDAAGEIYICDYNQAIYKIGTAMKLSASDFVAGEPANLSVAGATAGQRVYFAYSLDGVGTTNVPPLGVTLALRSPALAGSDVADVNGAASLTRTLPHAAAGATVWLQAAENGNTTDVEQRTVNN